MIIANAVFVLRRPRKAKPKKPRLNWRVMMGLDGQASTRAVWVSRCYKKGNCEVTYKIDQEQIAAITDKHAIAQAIARSWHGCIVAGV